MANYTLLGGLDLTTVKPVAKPGSLIDCLNFEVTTYDGYTRIAGLARFDGSEDVGSIKVWRLKYTGAAVFTAGERAWFDVALKGWVLYATEQSGEQVVYVMFPGSHPTPSLPDDLTDGTNTVSITSRDVVFDGFGTQENYNLGLQTIYDEQKARIGQVPGRVGSDIIGGFWYKDRQYAIRDLNRIAFEGGYYTDEDEGKYLEIDGLEYKILAVEVTGEDTGILTYDTETGAGTNAAPIGSAVLVDLPVTGDYGEGYANVPYSDDLDVTGGVSPYTWTLSGSEGTSITPVEAPDANEIDFLTQTTNAALYRAMPAGWTRCDLGREMQFSDGTSEIRNFLRSSMLTDATVLDTGIKYPTTGKVNGVVTTNMNSDNGTDAALAGTHTTFRVSGFDFSSVPENATIVGVEVVIDRHSNTGSEARDMTVRLTGTAAGTANKAYGAVWPNAPATVTYGGADDLWDSQQLTGSVVRNASFGVLVIAKRADPGVAMVGGIDYISMKVYYVEKDRDIYIWDGTTDVPMVLHHTQILSGTTVDNTAAGYMNVTADTNADKPRLVNVGDQIRSGASGAGVLLGYVAARDKPIWLAGQAELDVNRARYQFERHNFYGQDEFEAVYGVCGCSPAFSYDGSRMIRIRTQLPASKDLPRHVLKHGDMLALGYFPGAVVFSKPGDPHEMRGSEGASAVEVGDRLVGLSTLSGDAMGILCQSRTEIIRGLTPDSMVKLPISARRGGIEYTAVDMGRILLCDGLGIFAADSPESFGAAERNYLSMKVHPWLAPRLQAKTNGESGYLRPVCAINVRAKNQMRLFFWDGWILTVTMTEPPQFTTQRYFTPADDEHSEPTPWVPRMISSGIDSSGRERIMCSFYGGVNEGYVYEMDSGSSLDGEPIPAYVTMSPLTIGDSNGEKRYDRYHVYGTGRRWATLTASRYKNDDTENTGNFSFNMGRGDSLATQKNVPMRGVVDSPVEAFDISLRFDSNSATEGSFTLQYIKMIAHDRGITRGKQGSGE